MSTDFAPVAEALRTAITEHFAARGEDMDTEAGRTTIDTNSSLAAGRAEVLVETYLARSGRATLEGVRVADLGCGFGAVSLALGARGASVMAIDPNKRRMRVGAELADRFGLDVGFRRATFQDHALPHATFDLVVVNNALCYVMGRDDRRAALVRARDVLVPGGWIVIRDPNRAHPRDAFTGLPLVHLAPPRVADAVLGAVGVPRSTVRMTTPRGATRALRRAGFADVAFDGAGGPPRVLDRIAGYHHVSGRRP